MRPVIRPYPALYDPDNAGWVRFRGYNKSDYYPDLEIAHYLAGLNSKNLAKYELAHLENHSVEECDEDGKAAGQTWRLEDCLVFDTELEGHHYALSGGRWYRIDADLANEVTSFFNGLDKVELPAAEAGDNEKKYNARLTEAGADFLCLDVKLVKPSDASSPIEVCDFLGKNGWLVHIKDKSESSRLSHLFNQGLVSAVILKRDAPFRDALRALIMEQPGGADYVPLICGSTEDFQAGQHAVVFGVLVNCPNGNEPRLPFFSLISLRHAVRRIRDELGFKVAFAWIKKPGVGAPKKTPRAKKAA